MQLLRVAAVLTAVLPALAIAAVCDDTANSGPNQIKADYEKFETAFLDIAKETVKKPWGVHRLKYRATPYDESVPFECKSSASITDQLLPYLWDGTDG